MALRMVLVSLVASLGLNLPSSAELDRWTRSTRCWLDTQRAAWDARMPTDAGAFVRFDEIEDFGPPTQSVALLPVTQIETPAAQAPLPASTFPLEAVFAEGAPAVVFALPLKVEAEPIVSDQAFETVMTEMATAFSADLEPVTQTLPPNAVATVEPAEIESEPFDLTFAESMENLFHQETETLLNRAQDVATLDPAPPSAAVSGSSESGQTQAEPVVTTEIQPASTAEAVAARTTPSDRLELAFKLTREAALAWASLLHAPAVVTISQ